MEVDSQRVWAVVGVDSENDVGETADKTQPEHTDRVRVDRGKS